jgi:hypothetical protein
MKQEVLRRLKNAEKILGVADDESADVVHLIQFVAHDGTIVSQGRYTASGFVEVPVGPDDYCEDLRRAWENREKANHE